jgi:glutamate decarboxylase
MHRIKRDPYPRVHYPTYAARNFVNAVPKDALPAEGMAPDVAYQIVHDELSLDANPSLNLASFVSTWMEPQARRLIDETLSKNLIDEVEYPQTHAVASHVIAMLADLFHAPFGTEAVGVTTVGSSEAILLAFLAHKRTWQNRRRAQGLPHDRPNLVMGADVHTCLEKFTRYFEVEARIAPMQPGSYVLTADDVAARVDENTIAVCGIVGTTFTGQMDAIVEINALLANLEETRGWRIPLHVDAASGGFVLPFAHPDLAWDFRLSHVRSINVSNHKFGLVYPGLGTLVFREPSDLPEELVFRINYLGGDMPNFSLNFSRPSAQVVAQYYNFLRLGRSGYERIIGSILENARYLAKRVEALGPFEMLGAAELFPVVVAKARDGAELQLQGVSAGLREYGWVVPAYTLPPHADETVVLRMVVRENLSRDMIDSLCDALEHVIRKLGRPSMSAGDRPIC